jgi:hypothetical protein
LRSASRGRSVISPAAVSSTIDVFGSLASLAVDDEFADESASASESSSSTGAIAVVLVGVAGLTATCTNQARSNSHSKRCSSPDPSPNHSHREAGSWCSRHCDRGVDKLAFGDRVISSNRPTISRPLRF